MKKLNESVLRQLILETIEEGIVTEGKRKKIKEAEPVPQPSVDTSGDVPRSGDFDMSDEQAASMSTPEVEKEKMKIDKAFEFYKQDPGDASLPILITTLETSLKYLKSLMPQQN